MLKMDIQNKYFFGERFPAQASKGSLAGPSCGKSPISLLLWDLFFLHISHLLQYSRLRASIHLK